MLILHCNSQITLSFFGPYFILLMALNLTFFYIGFFYSRFTKFIAGEHFLAITFHKNKPLILEKG